MKHPVTTLLMVASLALSSLALAQPAAGGMGGGHPKREGPPPADRVAQRMIERADQLGLSEDQVAQLQNIADNGGTREDIHDVLTDEQRKKLHEARQQNGHRKHRGEPPAQGAAESGQD